jgi:hypothetical protein
MPQRSNVSLAGETKKPLRRDWVKRLRFGSFGTKLLRGRANFKGRLKTLQFSLALASGVVVTTHLLVTRTGVD